jgi:hypothetical protein
MATAAALVLVCFALARRQPLGFDTGPVGTLVSLWADSDESAEDWPQSDLLSVAARNEADDHWSIDQGAVDQEETDGFEEADDLAVPGWMLAAVESPPDDKLDNKLEEN